MRYVCTSAKKKGVRIMGGIGSGRHEDPTNAILRVQNVASTPIAVVSEPVVLPNTSSLQSAVKKGISESPILKVDHIAEKTSSHKIILDSVTNVDADSPGADTIYVANVLYNTDATPPAANTVPIGTIYIQYTA